MCQKPHLSPILPSMARHPNYHPEMADYQPSTDTTTLNQLEQQYTDIYTQLKQLQPTSTTHPIVLNAANLEGKTAEKAIAKGQRYINQDLRRNLSQTKSRKHRRYIRLRKRTPTPERTSKNR